MVVAVFDPGTHLGVLKAPLREKAAIVLGVTLYTAKLRETRDYGAWLKSADDPIREALRGVSEAYIEAPNTQGQNHYGIIKNIGAGLHISYWAAHMGVPVRWINLKHAKTALCDNGNANKTKMMAAAEYQLGVKPGGLTEHEADAFGLWLVASYGEPKSATQRGADRATARRLERERLRAEKVAAKAGAQDPLF